MRKHKPKRKLRAQTGVTLWLAGVIAAVWLVGMACATIALAEGINNESYTQNQALIDRAYQNGRLPDAYENFGDTPGRVEYALYETLAHASSSNYYLFNYRNTGLSVLRNMRHTVQTAGLVLRADSTVFAQTEDFIHFQYQTQQSWDAGAPDSQTDGFARARFDRNALTQDAWEFMQKAYWTFDVRVTRLTGTLDGTEFAASKIEYIPYDEFEEALYSTSPTMHTVSDDGLEEYTAYLDYVESDIIRETGLEWHTAFHDPALETPDDIVLYATYVQSTTYEPTASVTYKDTSYNTLADLLAAYAEGCFDEPNIYNDMYHTDSLFNQITLNTRYVHEKIDNGTQFPDYELRYTLLVGTQFSPIKAAISELRNVYIWTFLLAFALFWYARKAIRKHIVSPVETIADGMAEDFRYLGAPDHWPQQYRDLDKLVEQYNNTRTRLAMQRDEIRRLQTSLDYTKRAEQNRREMTSHIAHELKTPLAVLHSYAEGLTDRIAEDKRDHYLAVIQGEVERMDAMVLEMLDLSRLEAGRVSLLREDFSLGELVCEVWDRLAKAAENRGLQTAFDLKSPDTINADRARIEQVVTNYLTNAVRYTTENGSIKISVSAFRGKVTLAVENDAEPFAQEALSKVFDSFYRADESRTSPGTGLGLAICKRIVELHGGSCAVRNTETGVEFRFTV